MVVARHRPPRASLAHRDAQHLTRIVAITSPEASINLLVKLGFYFDRMVLMPGDKEEVKLFARRLGKAEA